MEIQRCPRGHFYDADQNSKCPTCESGGGDFDMNVGMDSLGATEPAGFYFSDNPTQNEFTPQPRFEGFGGGSSFDTPTEFAQAPGGAVSSAAAGGGYEATTPIGGFGGAASYGAASAPAASNDGYSATTPINPFGGAQAPAADDGYAPTSPISPIASKPQAGGKSAGAPAVSQKMSLPVVGWLVCIEGSNKGADYRIHGQYNYIGRGSHMDICITGDNYISTERAAVIAYDDLNKAFFFAPGMGTNIVRVNDMMVMSHVQLKPYDRIQIGMTKLLFVPFCGERFDWNA